MHVLVWLGSGLLVGWLARVLMRGRSYGFVADLSIGSAGGVVGGWLLRMLGVTEPHAGPLGHGAAAIVGAMALIALSRLIRQAADRSRAVVGPSLPSSQDLEAQLHRLGALERRVVDRFLKRQLATRDPNALFEEQLSWGQRLADQVASFGGSWTFICLFGAIIVAWLVANTELRPPFDPYPFILLNLVLSCLAALQAPVIMMSQNRQAAKDRCDARSDYEINLRAELEIQQLHAKLDELRQRDWAALVEMQRTQIQVLNALSQKLVDSREAGA
jgi:uncharacterized membrane protein/uncharacterized membrane protein YeaQ/YmgE (transglycosylase-associated protein family)